MLIAPDATFRDLKGITGRVFPAGAVPPVFRSSLPTAELYQALATDARDVTNVLASWSKTNGAFQLDQIATVMRLQLADQITAAKQRIFGMATKFGMVDPDAISALPLLYNVASQIYTVAQQDLLAEQLAKDVSLTIIGQIAPFVLEQIPFGGWAGFAVNFGLSLTNILSESLSGDYSTAQRRMPLVTPSRAADEFIVEQVHSYVISSNDWTNIFLPAHVGTWTILEAGTKRKPSESGRWGFTFGQAIPGQVLEDGLTPAGGIGGLPGTMRLWSSIQLDCSRIRNGRDRNAWWPMLHCNFEDTGCYANEEDFNGSRNCRQCVTPNNLRGTSRGDYKYSLFAPQVTEAINVGDGYPTGAQSIASLASEIRNPKNPASWSVHVPTVGDAWGGAVERFFDEDAQRLWTRHDAYGWRYVCSNFFSWFLVNHEGEIAGRGCTLDWRQRWGDNLDSIGGKMSGAPVQSLNITISSDHAGPMTSFTLENSWWSRLVRPALEELARVQLWGYRTTMVAYLPRTAGAHWNAATGKLRNDAYGRAYETGLRDLYTSARRFSVDLRDVIEPDVKAALIASGVSPQQIGHGVQAPDIAKGPKKNPPRAKQEIVKTVPTLGDLRLVVADIDPGPVQPLDPDQPETATLPPPSLPGGGFPGLTLGGLSHAPQEDAPAGWSRAATIGAGALGLGLLGLGTYAAIRSSRKP